MRDFINAELFRFEYDWKKLVLSIKDQESVPITPDPSIWRMDIPAYSEILNTWKSANYPEHMIKWNNY
jgi:hypothetical protein